MNHVIAVIVENKPGVLARVSSMFARRGFNIHSLTVGPTEDPAMSRMTVVVDGPEMEQIIKQLYKLVHTVKVTEFEPGTAIEREIMLVRVERRPEATRRDPRRCPCLGGTGRRRRCRHHHVRSHRSAGTACRLPATDEHLRCRLPREVRTHRAPV